jgi:hypothetical protein
MELKCSSSVCTSTPLYLIMFGAGLEVFRRLNSYWRLEISLCLQLLGQAVIWANIPQKTPEFTPFSCFVLVASNVAQYGHITLFYQISGQLLIFLARCSEWFVLSMKKVGRSRDRIPVGARFSARPDLPWGPPSLLYNGYRVFPGGKVRPECAADHSPPSSADVLEE